MRLVLVRHALPVRVDVVSDAPDPELADLGHRQAAALADALAGEPVDAVWSSPLRRAVQTVEPLASRRGLEIRTHPGLAEFDFGHGVYIPLEDVGHPVVQEMKARIDAPQPDAELVAFRETVTAAVEDVVATAAPEQTVVVSCHGGTVNAYVSAVVGATRVMIAKMDYTGFSTVTISRAGYRRLVSVNEHQHLRALG